MSGASDVPDEEDGEADDRPGTENGTGAVETPESIGRTGRDEADGAETPASDPADEDLEALRAQVEEKYDFDDFGPADMAEMSAEEWDVAFDPETWITGEELLDRVEADLKQRVANRDVFARIERGDDRVLAYSDTGYATVYADGSVEGQGTVLRDVKPTVARGSMESNDVPENPPEELLPEPQEVPEGSGRLGNWMLQAVAGAQVLGGVVLLGAWLLVSIGVLSPPGGGTVRGLNVIGMLVAGVIFVAIGLLLFTVVANARLSDRFRAEEYRNRLRAVDLEPGERPEFLPEEGESDRATADGEDVGPTDGDSARPGAVESADGEGEVLPGDGSDADGQSGADGDAS